ncbi:MAG: SDR family oxidoreductase [Puniceicoccaceae bacterium]
MPQNLFDLSGQVIVVTGSTGALAGAVARHLVENQAEVVFLGRSEEKLAQTLSSLGNPTNATPFACDVTDRDGLQEVRQAVLDKFGRIDGLINGAGGNMPGATIPPGKTVFDLDLADYDQVLELNLKGTLIPSLVFSEPMVSAARGSIINFSSASSAQALTRVLGYSNAKAAVDNLTRWMATDFAKKGLSNLRVNAVCPGFFIGDQNRALLLNSDGSLTERGQQIVAKTPMGRFGEADEVCGAVHFLLSPASKFVTGQILSIDGGFGIYTGV